MPQKKESSLQSKCQLLSCVQLFDPMECSCQASLSMEFSRQEYCSGLPFPSPGNLSNWGIKPRSPALQVNSLPREPLVKPLYSQNYTEIVILLTLYPCVTICDSYLEVVFYLRYSTFQRLSRLIQCNRIDEGLQTLRAGAGFTDLLTLDPWLRLSESQLLCFTRSKHSINVGSYDNMTLKKLYFRSWQSTLLVFSYKSSLHHSAHLRLGSAS